PSALERVERALQPLAPDRLEQIIDRRRLEGAERMLVVGGDEHDQSVGPHPLQQLEPGHPGHVDVQEQRVHVARGNLEERRLPSGRRTDDVDPAGRLQALHDLLERAGLVVDDVGAEAAGHGLWLARSGSVIVTCPPPSRRPATSVAREPKSTASLARRLSSPCPGGAAARSIPGPSSHTLSPTRSPSRRAATRISAPAGRAAATCLTLFWTSV